MGAENRLKIIDSKDQASTIRIVRLIDTSLSIPRYEIVTYGPLV